jgi:Ser/Thr protein kinase RdoA (MazF antagonist)
MAELATSRPYDAFTERAALCALARACQRVGMSAELAELIRMGSNAVFRLDTDTIARVSPSSVSCVNVQKQIDVARWLDSIDYPATRAIDVRQPVEVDGLFVTFWKSISLETIYASIGDVAALIKRLHTLTAPSTLTLPALRPFGTEFESLPCFPGLSPDDARYLRSRTEWARATFNTLPFELPAGIIHGDANVGNVLVDSTGRAVLIDLDSFATGPREWDLIQTALFFDRLGWHSAEEYQKFVETYGFDIMQWAGYSALADMREIAMTSWLGKKAENSEGAAKEARKRIAAIRSGWSRRDWGAY